MNEHHPPLLIGRPDEIRAGVIVPFDMALDSELWRWAPDGVSLLFSRTPFAAMLMTVAMAEIISDEGAVEQCTRDLLTARPAAYAYACTSGSFVNGMEGEKRLVETMRSTGGAKAVTTSGALLAALKHLGIRRVAIATPYDARVTERLVAFLAEADVDVASSAHLGLSSEIWDGAVRARRCSWCATRTPTNAEAVFVSCIQPGHLRRDRAARGRARQAGHHGEPGHDVGPAGVDRPPSRRPAPVAHRRPGYFRERVTTRSFGTRGRLLLSRSSGVLAFVSATLGRT